MVRRYVHSSPPISYESFLEKNKKYDGNSKCFVHDCNERALYEGGDVRFYCGMCEKHAAMSGKYRLYLNEFYPVLNSNLTNEQLYNLVLDRHEYVKNKIRCALEVIDGPEFSQTE